MANTIDYMHMHIYYFVGLLIMITLFSIAGAFPDNEVVFNPQFSNSLAGGVNRTVAQSDAISSWTWKDNLKDIFSFFFWNISIYDEGLMDWLWLIRIIFVFVPLLSLLITIIYTMPLIGN